MFKLFFSKPALFKIVLITAVFKDVGTTELANVIYIISNKYGAQNVDILCKRVNGNISSIEADLVELVRRIKLSIERRLNEWNSKYRNSEESSISIRE